MKTRTIIGLIIVAILSGCHKDPIDDSPFFITKDSSSVKMSKAGDVPALFVLTDNINLFSHPEIRGIADTFTREGFGVRTFAPAFSTENGFYKLQIDIHNGLNGQPYMLQVVTDAIPEPGTVLPATFNAMNATGDTIAYATHAEVVFSQFDQNGRITGTINTLWNEKVWCTGQFDFILTQTTFAGIQ